MTREEVIEYLKELVACMGMSAAARYLGISRQLLSYYVHGHYKGDFPTKMLERINMQKEVLYVPIVERRKIER